MSEGLRLYAAVDVTTFMVDPGWKNSEVASGRSGKKPSGSFCV